MPLPPRIHKSFTGLLHATIAVVFLLSALGASAQDKALVATGEKLFKANCASCHKPDKDMTGPALKGSKARWEGKGDIYAWVKNSSAVIKSGNAYANELFNKWNKSVMTPNAVSNEDIDAILAYVEAYTPKVAPPPPGGNDVQARKAGDDTPWQWLVIVVLLLLVVVLSLANVKHQLKNAVRERDGLAPLPEYSLWGSVRSWALIFGFIFFCWLIVQGWNWAINIGVYGGEEVAHYKPEQPIQFNHTTHAGKLAINCQYCHSSAEKSKHAGIPSANVCMNCHKAINEGPITGTAEIAKIYEATGWDPATNKYTGVEKPIQWVKVHNLPDHVAFSHATHVAIGKIECQKCHGPVDTKFDVAEQWSPLTMGWCIQCHNETEVQMANNGYYDEIHRRLKETPMGNKELQQYLEDEKITVKELGGWECAKCHY
jgi:mono/diheme cytochrome c family protein